MITSLDDVTEFPLCWPDNKPRAAERVGSPFHVTMAKALADLDDEMRHWRAAAYVISKAPQYRRGPTDPGVALWFKLTGRDAEGGLVFPLRVLACDRYTAAAGNVRAIGLTLSALRACDRWGAYTAEQAIEGARLALPPPNGGLTRDWWQVLAVTETTPIAVVEAAYRALAKERHQDAAAMVELNLAVEAARRRAEGAKV